MPKLHSWRGADSWIGAEKSGEMRIRGGAPAALTSRFIGTRICTQQLGAWPEGVKNGVIGVRFSLQTRRLPQ